MNGNVARTPQTRSHARPDQRYVTYHDFDGAADLTTTVVHAISDVTGVDPTDAGFRLYDHVDPDALNTLFRPRSDDAPRNRATLSFRVWEYQVTVQGDGRITVVPLY